MGKLVSPRHDHGIHFRIEIIPECCHVGILLIPLLFSSLPVVLESNPAFLPWMSCRSLVRLGRTLQCLGVVWRPTSRQEPRIVFPIRTPERGMQVSTERTSLRTIHENSRSSLLGPVLWLACPRHCSGCLCDSFKKGLNTD